MYIPAALKFLRLTEKKFKYFYVSDGTYYRVADRKTDAISFAFALELMNVAALLGTGVGPCV